MSITLSDKGPGLINILTLMFLVKGSRKHNSWDMDAKICLKEFIQSPQMKWGGREKRGKKKKNKKMQRLISKQT